MRKFQLQVDKSLSGPEIKIQSGLDEYADPNPGPLPFPVPRGITAVGDRLGAGAEGIVYRVETERFGACALKYSHVSSMASFLTHRLLDEAKTMEAIGPHPNLVRLYDYGTTITEGGSYDWLLMELHQGDLIEWMNAVLRRPWELSPENQRLIGDDPTKFEKQVLLDGMNGLEHMHSRGFIHRDVKLANMGLALKPSVHSVVADLGFTKRITRPDGTLIPEGERTFGPSGTQAFFSVRVERNQHQYYGDDIQSLLFSFLAYTYLYDSDVFSDGLGRVLEKQEILDRPDQYGRLTEAQQYHKRRAKAREFVIRALDICIEQENAAIANHLLLWCLEHDSQEWVQHDFLDLVSLQRAAERTRNTGFFMFLVSWMAKVNQQSLSGFARELLSRYAKDIWCKFTRVAWEVLVELSGAPLRTYLFPFICTSLAYHLSDSCYEGKPLPGLTRLFASDTVFLSPTSLIAAFEEFDSFPSDAKLIVYDEMDVIFERGYGRYSPSVRISLATNRIEGPALMISPRVKVDSFGADRLTALGLHTVHLNVVFPGSADTPLGHLRRIEVNGSDWADAKTGKLPTGVIVLEKNGQVSAYPTKRLDPAVDLADSALMPRPVAPDSVKRFRLTDRVYLCLFNIIDVAIRLKQE